MIDLDDLEGLCPGLPKESAGPLALRASVALERRHSPGVVMDTTIHGTREQVELHWSKLPATVAPTQDDLRVTEEGAVAIALALSARYCRWRVVRCLQARLGEGADWLMLDAMKRRIVLEVGEIARLGAVTAALSAGEPLRALQLAERFLAEGLADEVEAKLRQLANEADAELARAATDETTVMPVTFTLRAA